MPEFRSVLSIGTFDGVHVGHAALIRRARALADADGLRVVALTFDPHPMTKLNPAAAPARLSTFEQRAGWLREAGADEVVRLAPTDDVLVSSPEGFIERMVGGYAPRWFVEGPDFRFGRGRSGDVATLARIGAASGFGCEVVASVEVALSDDLIVKASSSIARWLLVHGRVRDALAVLGRPYEVVGMVVNGDRRGREIGFPTVNISTEQLLPADGVYAGLAVLPDGRRVAAAANVGSRPTFAGVGRRIEAHLLFDGSQPADDPNAWKPIAGLPEYGWGVKLRLISFLRDDLRFDSVERLVEQMGRDCDRAREIAGRQVAVSDQDNQAATSGRTLKGAHA